MEEYFKSFLYSTPPVFLAVFLSLSFGTVISKRLAAARRRSVLVNAFLNSIVFTPHFVFAYFVYAVFGSSLFLQKNGLTIVFAYTLKQTPFVVFYLLPTLDKIRKEEYETLALMGAGRLRSFMTADFPRLFPAYAEITVILASFIYTAYEIPAMLGITYPKFFGVMVYDTYSKYSGQGRGSAIQAMIVFTLALFAFCALLLCVSNRYRYYTNKEGGIEIE